MISVIVPVYNGRLTLNACLQAIFSSADCPKFEVIVVDDGSTDSSPEIAGKYPCQVLRLEKSRGRSHARNMGAARARNGVLVFVDADIIISKTALRQVADFFTDQPEVSAVVGLLDDTCPYPDFFSQYKNLYMNHIFNRLPPRINFLYGSLCALRREHFEPFQESLSMGEDTELGQRLTAKGRTIMLLHGLRVTHWKRFRFKGIVQNDFLIPYSWAHLFLKNRGLSQLLSRKRFAHAQGGQVGSVVAVPLAIVSASLAPLVPAMLIPLGVFLAAHILLNARFHGFLLKKKGPWFAGRAVVFTLFDQLVMFCGIVGGAVHHVWNSVLRPGRAGRED
jgi:glycosyltransferase involved in cell wall biosynthesis